MTTMITVRTAAKRLAEFARDGRLVQRTWHQRRDGRELACALGAMDPSITSVESCPSAIMPPWVAAVTVELFDKLPGDRLAECALAYAAE
jgi:hypothetical protein